MRQDMKDALEHIQAQNRQDGLVSEIAPPTEFANDILMLDCVTKRVLTPMLQEFFDVVGEWREALAGKSVYHPSTLERVYSDDRFKFSLSLRRENFWPHPPWSDKDMDRTALFAWDDVDEGEAYFWWRNDGLEEPLVVTFLGGSVRYWPDLLGFLKDTASGGGDLSIDLLEELREERKTSGLQ